jgi:hypothetical protein
MAENVAKMSESAKGKTLIGWNEYVSLPDWGIRRLRAKVDTGARTSALHVDNIVEAAGNRVSFDVVVDRRRPHKRVRIETDLIRRARVRSSTGHYALRIFVETKVRVGPVERIVALSLVDRSDMTFRMLLGRSALAGPFLIDASRKFVLGKPLRRRKRPS